MTPEERFNLIVTIQDAEGVLSAAIDGTAVGTLVDCGGTGPRVVTIDVGPLAEGNHTLTLSATNGSDSTVLIVSPGGAGPLDAIPCFQDAVTDGVAADCITNSGFANSIQAKLSAALGDAQAGNFVAMCSRLEGATNDLLNHAGDSQLHVDFGLALASIDSSII
jgi:hypothetical protein